MTQVMEALTAQGIEGVDVQTVSYQVWQQEVMDREGIPTGEFKYHAGNHIRVRVADPSKAGTVASAALAAGATTVQGITFAIADPSALGAWPKTPPSAYWWEIGPLPGPFSAPGGTTRPSRSRFWVQSGSPSQHVFSEATFRLGF